MSEIHLARPHLRSLISNFKGKRVLVIGDMVADQYLIGRPTRISREAPVLILELDEERTLPGGATNVAVNARSLEAEVLLAGVVGNDVLLPSAGRILERGSLRKAPVARDRAANALNLAEHAAFGFQAIVERLRDFRFDYGASDRQTNAEVAASESMQRA